MLGQLSHSAIEAARQELFRDVQALKFVHRFNLLLALGSGIVKGLVLLFDERNLAFDFLVPLSVIVLLSLLVLLFKFADFLQFCLLFDLQDGLFD